MLTQLQIAEIIVKSAFDPAEPIALSEDNHEAGGTGNLRDVAVAEPDYLMPVTPVTLSVHIEGGRDVIIGMYSSSTFNRSVETVLPVDTFDDSQLWPVGSSMRRQLILRNSWIDTNPERI